MSHRIIYILILISLFFHTNAKEWFPISAKWYFSYTVWDNIGYTLFEVTEDTIINDIHSKIVKQTNTNQYGDEYETKHYFTEDNGKIFYYKDDVYTLLYDFSLSVGDTFTLVRNNTNFNICDTMQYVIDSIKNEPKYNDFKTQYIHYTKIACSHNLPSGVYEMLTATKENVEYIGNTVSLFYEFGLTMDMAPPMFLRCYADDSVALRFFIEPGVSCDTIITKTNNRKIEQNIKIFPNPAYDIFKIDISKVNLKIKGIEVLDIIGNIIYKTENIQPILAIDLSNHTKGMYIVKIRFEDNYYQTFKILKYDK